MRADRAAGRKAPARVAARPRVRPVGLAQARVAEVGEGVTGIDVGDRVFGVVMTPVLQAGTMAQYAAVPATYGLARIPDGLSARDAGALGLAGTAALDSLDAVKVSEGDTVLISGATGGVGAYAVQLAAARGARVIATARPGEEADFVTGLTDAPVHVVDYAGDLEAEVREIAPAGVDTVLHLAGDVARLAGLLRADGRLASTLGLPADAVEGTTIHPVLADPCAETLTTLALPAATGIAPVLTPPAATGLVIVMIGAMITHARRREPSSIVVNAALLVAVAVIGNTPLTADGDRGPTAQAVRDVLEAIRLADEVGLDFFGIGEHHTRTMPLSSPTSVINAAARRPRRRVRPRRHGLRRRPGGHRRPHPPPARPARPQPPDPADGRRRAAAARLPARHRTARHEGAPADPRRARLTLGRSRRPAVRARRAPPASRVPDRGRSARDRCRSVSPRAESWPGRASGRAAACRTTVRPSTTR